MQVCNLYEVWLNYLYQPIGAKVPKTSVNKELTVSVSCKISVAATNILKIQESSGTLANEQLNKKKLLGRVTLLKSNIEAHERVEIGSFSVLK